MRFLDTNILLYAASVDPSEASKRDIASNLLGEPDLALSAQVLQEFIAVALKKSRIGLSEQALAAALGPLFELPCAPITRELVIAALRIRSRFKVSHWDATIIAAAQELGCDILYSEDLAHAQSYDGVRVLNPFLKEGVG